MSKYIRNPYDYQAVHEQAEFLVKNRKHLKREAVEHYKAVFDEKCKLSKKETERAKQHIPGGIQHNLANNHPFALTMVKADGPYLYDIDGNRYLDFLCAGGPIILGNNYPTVKKETLELIEKNGPLTGLYSTYESEMAELVKENFPSVELLRMLGSGTEADIIAIRLARAYTGKKHIIRIAGGYHGWSDQLVYNDTDNNCENGMFHGIPYECYQYTHSVPANDVQALEEMIERYKNDGGVAAFIMEAVGQDSGIVPTTKEYHKAAEQICRKNDMLLIYDEVVTAFRLGLGGAQAIFGTRPDLTVFGKIISGGYAAAGAVGGRKEIMDMLAAGVGVGYAKKVKVGGTLSANQLSLLGGITAIKTLKETNAYEKLEKKATYFMEGLQEITDKYDVPALLFNHQSILHIDVGGFQHVPYVYKKSEPNFQEEVRDAFINMLEFSMALTAEGLIISSGGKTYLSLAACDVVDDALSIYDKVFSQFE